MPESNYRQPIDRLVIFDFSGTLSIQSVVFGTEENLTQALKESGLWELGLNSTDRFWNEVVNPTWTQGSTTSIGYEKLLTNQISRILQLPLETVASQVSAFARKYFQSFEVYPAWKEVFEEMNQHPGCLILIATDHYAEATGWIIRKLQARGLAAASVFTDSIQQTELFSIWIANSSDVGYPKASREFWLILKQRLSLHSVSLVMVVDDFGFNEQPKDDYSSQEKVRIRQTRQEKILNAVFNCPVRVFKFFMPDKNWQDWQTVEQQYRQLIFQVKKFLVAGLNIRQQSK